MHGVPAPQRRAAPEEGVRTVSAYVAAAQPPPDPLKKLSLYAVDSTLICIFPAHFTSLRAAAAPSCWATRGTCGTR